MSAPRLPHGVRSESGQSIVMFALMSTFVMMILALVVETGFIYIKRRELQNAADAAAFAGAQKLPDSPSTAISDAQSWAARNVSGLTYNVATVSNGNLTLTVTVKKNAATIFHGWFGIGGDTITATASTKVRAAQLPGIGVVPFAINYSTYLAHLDGNLVTLKLPGSQGNSGNYNLIDIGSSPGSAICPYIAAGSSVPITDPGTSTEPGAKTGLSRCVQDRMTAAASNHCVSLSDVKDASGRLVDRCNPMIGAKAGANGYTGVQPTAVIIMPVLTDASFNAGINGNKPVSLQQLGDGQRLFAMFLVDSSTVNAVNGGPTCPPSGQCNITGRFLTSFNAGVLPSGSVALGDYGSASIAKVVQLQN